MLHVYHISATTIWLIFNLFYTTIIIIINPFFLFLETLDLTVPGLRPGRVWQRWTSPFLSHEPQREMVGRVDIDATLLRRKSRRFGVETLLIQPPLLTGSQSKNHWPCFLSGARVQRAQVDCVYVAKFGLTYLRHCVSLGLMADRNLTSYSVQCLLSVSA